MEARKNKTPLIGIIGGQGQMGRLFADFFRTLGVEILVSDIGTKLTNKKLAEQSDIVIISVPINQTEKVIKEVLPHIRRDAAIMDLTSIKGAPVKWMLKGKCEVMGMHPMFGSTNPIPGQTIILCHTKKSGYWSKWMEDFLKENHVRIEKLTPRQHDQTMNIAQGLIHFAEIAFADSVRRCGMPVEKLFHFTGKASEMKVQLAARLIAQDANLYGNIQISNPYALKSLKEFQKSVEELIKIVAKKDLAGFKKYFEKNKKFYGKYLKEAYSDSSYLIDRLMELKTVRQKKILPKKPDKNDLAILGPANTFSHIAADKYSEAKKYFAHDIDEIFELVEKGTVREGLVPIENKLHGTVRETLDALFQRDVHICREITIPINHCLVCLTHAKKSDIKTISSHLQALSQCKKYLHNNFSKAEKEAVSSTSAAIQKLLSSNDKSLAVIASTIAAHDPKLKILATNIADEEDNATTFVAIKKGRISASKNISKDVSNSHKTFIAFYFSANAPGTLFTVFQDFANAKINLTKIESRPTQKAFGEYIFYLDFNGHVSEPHIQKALQSVAAKVAELKILGSY